MKIIYWLPVVGLLTVSLDAQTSAGNVRFIRQATSSLDPYTSSTTTTQQQWFQTHFYRMTVYSPYFDDKLSWYPNAGFYKDLYAIYVNDALATQHPEWILKDANGNKLYIPWGCSGAPARNTPPMSAARPSANGGSTKPIRTLLWATTGFSWTTSTWSSASATGTEIS